MKLMSKKVRFIMCIFMAILLITLTVAIVNAYSIANEGNEISNAEEERLIHDHNDYYGDEHVDGIVSIQQQTEEFCVKVVSAYHKVCSECGYIYRYTHINENLSTRHSKTYTIIGNILYWECDLCGASGQEYINKK